MIGSKRREIAPRDEAEDEVEGVEHGPGEELAQERGQLTPEEMKAVMLDLSPSPLDIESR